MHYTIAYQHGNTATIAHATAAALIDLKSDIVRTMMKFPELDVVTVREGHVEDPHAAPIIWSIDRKLFDEAMAEVLAAPANVTIH